MAPATPKNRKNGKLRHKEPPSLSGEARTVQYMSEHPQYAYSPIIHTPSILSSQDITAEKEATFVQVIGIDILLAIFDTADEHVVPHSLAQTCRHFRTAVKMWLHSNIKKLMGRNGIDYSSFMLRALDRTGSVLSGPEALTAWYPTAPVSGRMEVFCPNIPEAYMGMLDHLTLAEGFDIQAIIHPEGPDRPRAFRSIYGDFAFGRTVKAAVTLQKTRPIGNITFTCVLLIGIARESPTPMVLEQPSTIFMNTITGKSMVSYYPGRTFYALGLMNYEGPVLPHAIPSTRAIHGAKFKLTTRNPDSFKTHQCGTHSLCPNTIRNTLDNRSATTDFCHFYNDVPLAKREAQKLVIWRLRCAGMCGEAMLPEPYQIDSVMGLYVTETYVAMESM